MSEEATAEVEANPIQDMINYALDQNFNKANNVFNDMMTVKMSDLLDQEKINLAGQIYNGEEPEDDQLELDLETEDGIEAEEGEDLQEPDSEDEEVEDNSDEWEEASFEEDDEEEN